MVGYDAYSCMTTPTPSTEFDKHVLTVQNLHPEVRFMQSTLVMLRHSKSCIFFGTSILIGTTRMVMTPRTGVLSDCSSLFTCMVLSMHLSHASPCLHLAYASCNICFVFRFTYNMHQSTHRQGSIESSDLSLVLHKKQNKIDCSLGYIQTCHRGLTLNMHIAMHVYDVHITVAHA